MSIYRGLSVKSFFYKVYIRLVSNFRNAFDSLRLFLFWKSYINGFHHLLYRFLNKNLEKNDVGIYWFGVPVIKSPFDLWVYQEIIWETKPDIIIETGTYKGGSSLFLASILESIGKGTVITVDIENLSGTVSHPRIKKIIGDSVGKTTIEEIKKSIRAADRIMVILDSAHNYDHVLREMELYGDFVTPGCYMIVEDSNVNGHPVLKGWGAGPWEAIQSFLKNHKNFSIDKRREKFMVTFHPSGFLKKHE